MLTACHPATGGSIRRSAPDLRRRPRYLATLQEARPLVSSAEVCDLSGGERERVEAVGDARAAQAHRFDEPLVEVHVGEARRDGAADVLALGVGGRAIELEGMVVEVRGEGPAGLLIFFGAGSQSAARSSRS